MMLSKRSKLRWLTAENVTKCCNGERAVCLISNICLSLFTCVSLTCKLHRGRQTFHKQGLSRFVVIGINHCKVGINQFWCVKVCRDWNKSLQSWNKSTRFVVIGINHCKVGINQFCININAKLISHWQPRGCKEIMIVLSLSNVFPLRSKTPQTFLQNPYKFL